MERTAAKPAVSKTGNVCFDAPTDRLARVYRALGHPARLAILKALVQKPDACCGDIVETLPLAQSTVSQHLQVLREAGLLTCCTRGRCCHYGLDMAMLESAARASQDFMASLASSLPPACGSDKTHPETSHETSTRSADDCGTTGEDI